MSDHDFPELSADDLRQMAQQMSDRVIEKVQVPEWRKAVYVRSLTGRERDEYEASMLEFRGKKTRQNMGNLRARLLVLAICDRDGRRIYNRGDAELLGNLNAAGVDRVFEVAQRLSGLTGDDIEELAGNSGSGQSDDSGTASPVALVAP